MQRSVLLAGIFIVLAQACHADGVGQGVVKCIDSKGHVSFKRSCAAGEQSQAVSTTQGSYYDSTAALRAYDNTPQWQPPPPPAATDQTPPPDSAVQVVMPGPDHTGCGSILHRQDPAFSCAQ